MTKPISAARHNAIVNFIMDEVENMSPDELRNAVMARFADRTFAEMDRAMADAADRLRERELELNAQADALERFMPVFEGGVKGELLVDIAKRKAETGDELAIEFLRWCTETENDPDG